MIREYVFIGGCADGARCGIADGVERWVHESLGPRTVLPSHSAEAMAVIHRTRTHYRKGQLRDGPVSWFVFVAEETLRKGTMMGTLINGYQGKHAW